MRAIASIWTWFIIAFVQIAGFCLQSVLFVLTFAFDRDRRIVGRTYRLMGATAGSLAPTWRFRRHGDLPSRLPRRTVVVSNHCSNADPFLISRLPWEMKWLGKKNLFRMPIAGWSMWLNGDIPIDRGNRESAKEAMGVCKRYLERGMPVFIFPEGTRSKTPELLPFKEGAFRLAIDAGADILPLAVAGTRTALPKHDWKFGKARAFVKCGDYVSTEGLTHADVPALMATVRERIEALRAVIVPISSDGVAGGDSTAPTA